MTNYRRLISYIYAYEGEVKGKNIGFAKLESRSGQCRLNVNVKKVYVGSSDLEVYLLSHEKEICLGSIFIRGGAGEFRTVLSLENVAGSGCSMDSCYGLTIHEKNDAWRAYTTIWEDAVTQAAELQLAEVTSEKCGGVSRQIHKKVEELNRELSEDLPPDSETNRLLQPSEIPHESKTGPKPETEQTAQSVPQIEALSHPKTGFRPEAPACPERVGQASFQSPEAFAQPAFVLPEAVPGPSFLPSPSRAGQDTGSAPKASSPVTMGGKTPRQKAFIQNQPPAGAPMKAVNQLPIEPEPVISEVPDTQPYQAAQEVSVFDRESDGQKAAAAPDSQASVCLGQAVPDSQPSVRLGKAVLNPQSPARSGQGEPDPQIPARSTQGEPDLQSPARSGQPEPDPQSPVRQSQAEPPLQFSARSTQAASAPQPPARLVPAASAAHPVSPVPAIPAPHPAPAAPTPQTTPPPILQHLPQPSSNQPDLILCDPQILRQLEEAEQKPFSPQELWDDLRKKHPKIQAFDSAGGCEILTIRPQDIGLLPRETWTYGNNSFLLHGYYNYRYIILARVGDGEQNRIRYILGVPGNYYSNEKYMASMFGFPHFVLSKKQPSQDGRFGYWYTDIKMQIPDR